MFLAVLPFLQASVLLCSSPHFCLAEEPTVACFNVTAVYVQTIIRFLPWGEVKKAMQLRPFLMISLTWSEKDDI